MRPAALRLLAAALTLLRQNLNVTISGIFRLCPVGLPEEGRSQMKWTTPRIVEIAIGLEINSYACAELK